MEAKDLFSISKRLFYKVKWEGEYFHIGQLPHKDIDTLMHTISNYFQSDSVHLILDRQHSKTISLTALHSFLQTSDENFVLWDEHFNSSIDYHSIGVFRKGRIS
ncbi:hypothetical protein [Flammeovirga sp. SJP92]|uniref:hypothetical protein n=1 Tax=Flammeovirga sp. SJP92 TaxID=1775430 RepID=UPI000788506A|nr:hypothetical protein [Flammeovirga sp. SJP92]KXX66563.1 hypothetical protein AVL50_31595 [Flammeovirga sp. SJP92]